MCIKFSLKPAISIFHCRKRPAFVYFLCNAVFFFSSFSLLWSQQAIVASGGTSSGSGGSVSYSLGQVFYTTADGTSGNAFQGVQIPYEIYVVTGLKDAPEIALKFLAYPNPVYNQLILQISKIPEENLSYQLVDMQGSILREGMIYVQEVAFPFDAYAKGTYILLIFKEGKLVKTFKIVKSL